MTNLLVDPQRWRDGEGQAHLAERTAGETIRSLPKAEPLTPLQLARIAARIRATRHRRRLHRLIPAIAAFLLGIATAASAAHLNFLPGWLGGAKRKPVVMVAHESSSVGGTRRAKAATSELVGLPSGELPEWQVTPLPAEQVSEQTRPGTQSQANPQSLPAEPVARKSARKPAEPVGPSPATRVVQPVPAAAPGLAAFEPQPVPRTAPPPSMVEQEANRASQSASPGVTWGGGATAPGPAAAPPASKPAMPEPSRVPGNTSGAARYLGQAITLLRVEHTPKAALALLDRHASELREGALGHEALILKVEALLALRRQDQVLRLLDSSALSDVAASHSLLVTRGKLRAAAHRCGEGLGDFDLVLAESTKPEREALIGRLLCRKQLGDSVGARADLERYRRTFPSDPRLVELERRLATP